MFDYRLAREVSSALARHGVKYLFLGKSGAIVLGFPDTTQNVEVLPAKSKENTESLVAALTELGFELNSDDDVAIVQGKSLVQLKNGPFDLDLIFAPDGIETFEQAWSRHVEVEGMPVCHPDDIIASKKAAGREKDLESLPRLIEFRDYWQRRLRR